MADIFISYKKEDRVLAERVADALEGRSLDVWWDRDLIGGDDFRRRIKDEIDRAKVVIVIWSPLSVESDFVIDEAARAHAQEKLLPVTFEDAIEPPMGFGAVQIESLSEWQGKQDATQIQALEKKVNEIEAGRFRSAMIALGGTNLKPGRAIDAVRFLDSFAVGVGGMPLGRFVLGSFGLGLAFLLPVLAGSLLMGRELALRFALPLALIYIITAMFTRGFHQFILLAQGKSGRRFFNESFTFWVVAALLIGAIWASGLMLLQQAFDPVRFVVFSFVAGYATLFTVTAIQVAAKISVYLVTKV